MSAFKKKGTSARKHPIQKYRKKCENISCQNKFFPKTLNQKYCTSCGRERNPAKHSKSIKIKCPSCDGLMDTRSKTCRACSPQSKKLAENSELTLEELQNKLSVKGKHPSWKNAHVRIHAKVFNKHLCGTPCQNCGYSLQSDFAHIRDISDWPLTAKLKEINAESNILILCKRCHWEFDHDYLELKNIPERKMVPRAGIEPACRF